MTALSLEVEKRPAPPAQRSRGRASLRVKRGPGGTSRIADLFQQGCARIRLPRPLFGSEDPLEAITVNTSGGLTGGDRLGWDVHVEASASASVTGQACERLYRAPEGVARVTVDLRVEEGATLLWWPQETILFDHCALERELDAVVAASGRLLVVEAFLFGRAAMGERMERANLRDRWTIRRPDGALVHAERLRIEGEADLRGPAAMGGAGAAASLLLVAPDAERHLAKTRAILGPHGAASCWGGRLLARITAPGGYALRRRLVPLAALLAGRPVPRGWEP